MKTALEKQVDGSHYTDLKLQPIELIVKANLSFIQGNIIKYITRYERKNGLIDLKKCIHYAELAIELDSTGPDVRMVGLGYSYCKANFLSKWQADVVICAIRDDYYNVIRHCKYIMKEQYNFKEF